MQTRLKNLLPRPRGAWVRPALIAVLGMVLADRVAAQTFTTLYSFSAGSGSFVTNSDGVSPNGKLILSGNTLYGTASQGGRYGLGTAFKINTDGTGFKSLHSFGSASDNIALTPAAGLTLSGDTLYGTANLGGKLDYGTIFSFDTNGAGFKTLYSFTNGNDGANPAAELILSANTLYGTASDDASAGYEGGYGSVFAINTDGTGFRILHSFTATSDGLVAGTNSDGAMPGELILAGNTLYGTAQYGGGAGFGTIFAVNTNGSGFKTLYNFSYGSGGDEPEAGVILSGNTLYGTLAVDGSVFAVNTDGTGFTNLLTGETLPGGLILSGNTLYGTVAYGGASGNGTVFAVNTNGTDFTNLYNFANSGDGVYPIGLILSGDTLYGTTASGGISGHGTVFSIALGPVSAPQGSLQVTITPTGAVNAGARWQVDGGTYQNNGTTVSGLATGTHTVSFSAVPGWVAPKNQTVTIAKGVTLKATGAYTTVSLTATITYPKTGLTVSNATLAVSGTAKGSFPLASVYCEVNASGWNLATPSASWSNWTATVTLNPGTNTIRAYAVDTSGNTSAISSISVKFVQSAILTVQTSGQGTFSPNDNNKLLAIGTNYTLKAAPIANNLFSNWVSVQEISLASFAGGSFTYTVLTKNPSCTFTMQPGLVLQANFVTNLFLAAQGAYHGLFAPTNSPRQQTNSGAFTLNVTSTGVLSGDLYLGSATIPLSGKFDLSGAAVIPPIAKSKNPLTTTLQLNLADHSVQGTVTDGSFFAFLNGDQAVFSTTHKATSFQGQYTLIIPGANDPAVGPFGTSYGTATLTSSGAITFSVYLADGATASALSGFISKDGYWPFYVPLYNGAGSLWGWNLFTNQTLVSAPVLSWINPTNAAKTAAVYRTGFTNQQAAVTGSIFNPASKPLLNLTVGQVTLNENSWVNPILNQIALAANNTITVPASAQDTNGLTLKLATTGLVSGSFKNPTNPKQTIPINGVLLQNQTNAQGYFLDTNQSGAFILAAP